MPSDPPSVRLQRCGAGGGVEAFAAAAITVVVGHNSRSGVATPPLEPLTAAPGPVAQVAPMVDVAQNALPQAKERDDASCPPLLIPSSEEAACLSSLAARGRRYAACPVVRHFPGGAEDHLRRHALAPPRRRHVVDAAASAVVRFAVAARYRRGGRRR